MSNRKDHGTYGKQSRQLDTWWTSIHMGERGPLEKVRSSVLGGSMLRTEMKRTGKYAPF